MLQKIKKKLVKNYNEKILHHDPMEEQINEWRRAGVKIGKNCKIYSCLTTGRDSFLLSIGDNVTISGNVKFLMHDNAPIKVTNGNYTDILGQINIGSNCFIGYGSIILPGVSLAENTIIGAGSVVTKSVTNFGLCIGGNPAKIICTVKEYEEKNRNYFVNLENMSNDEVKKYFMKHSGKLIKK